VIEIAETQPETELPAGTEAEIGRYVIKRLVGSGGMGVVFAAHDPELDRAVAIKVTEASGDSAAAGPVREAQAMARLSHPNVVQVYEVLHLGTRKAIVMELVDGEELSAWQTREQRPWRDIVEVYVQASRGLAAAHRAGIVHRDFKPSNVLVDKDGTVRVTDFGLARDVVATSLRANGTGIAGTPGYMAPEQHSGGAVDARTDQWGFACALYEALYGHRPFSASEGPTLAAAVVRGQIEDEPSSSPVPRRIRAAIRRALTVDPAARFTSMDALAVALAPPPRRFAIGVGVAAVAIAVVVVALSVRKDDGPSCGGLDAPIRNVWTDSARDALRTRLTGTAVGVPTPTVESMVSGLDAYAASWTAARVQACTDGKRGVRSAPVLDARMQCLDRHLAEVSTLLDSLASGTSETLRSTSDAIAQLRPPSACLQTAPSPRATTPAVQAEIDAGETDLARASTFLSLDQYERASVAIQRAVVSGEHVSPSLLARSLVVRGQIVHRLGHEAEALADQQRAAKVAATAHEQTVLADALTNAFFIDTNGLGHLTDGLKSRPFIELAIESAGRPDEVRAQWLHVLSIALYEDPSHTDEAAGFEREALAIRQRILPAGHPFIYDSIQTLGNIEVSRGNYAEGLALFQQLLAHKLATRGPRDTSISEVNNNIGTVWYQRDDLLGALGYFETSVEIARSSGQPNPLASSNVGLTQLDLGRWTSATATFASFQAEAEQVTQGDSSLIAEAELYRGEAALLAGNLEQARSFLDGSVEHARASGSNLLSSMLSYSARLAIQLGDPKRARALIDEALPLSTPEVPLRTFVAAEVTLAETSCAAARQHLIDAYDLAVKQHVHVVVSQAALTLARCEIQLGDRAAAKARLETELAWLTRSKAEDVALAPVRAALAKTN
jgi:tetratricopeptide (TPR) repeat protein